MSAPTPHNTSGGPGGPGRPPAGVNGHGRAHARTTSSGGMARPPPSTLRDSRMGLSRSTSTQPSYNLFTGETTAPPSGSRPQRTTAGHGRQASQQSAVPDTQSLGGTPSSYRAASHESSKENMAPPDAGEYETQRRRIEELKAEVGALLYKVHTYEQEREMARLQHEAELRDARRKAEDDYKQRQAAEAERAAAARQADALAAELEGLRGDQDGRQRALERKVREAQDEARVLLEQMDDLRAAKDEAARRGERRAGDLEAQAAAAQRSLQALGAEAQAREAALQRAQQQLAEREAAAGRLEAEVLRLKAQTGDAATMDSIRRELKDQVNHIRALEATNRDQLTELRHLRQTHKAVEIVEEEKRSLLRKLEAAGRLETELAEERLQRQRLETEHRAWSAYLQTSRDGDGDGDAGGEAAEFDSPEAVARALMEARYRTAELTEKIGALEPELAQRDAALRLLEADNKALADELARLKAAAARSADDGGKPPALVLAPAPPSSTAAGSDAKARARLERQRALAVKEVAYLRAQLQTFDTEDSTFHPADFDQAKADRVRQLEALVDEHRAEAERLHTELSARESSAPPPAPVAGTKRALPGDGNGGNGGDGDGGDGAGEQVGQLVRKTRKLQDELAAARTAHRVLETELAVTREQLAAEKTAAGVRVLALRSNPTADHQAVQRATLDALRTENAELLAHVEAHGGKRAAGSASSSSAPSSSAPSSTPAFTTVPLSVLAAAQREIAEAQAETASAHKTSRRLKEVWAAKSAEFKAAVESTLGWHVTFIPNGKMRVESVYHPSRTEENENSIVFDGERGTMKVGGGPHSAFAQRIDDQIRFWVREKGCIPGFLAALTLEFCEEQARTGVAAR